MNGWQEEHPRSQELGGRYGLESRGSAKTKSAAEYNTSTPQASTNVVLCWFEGVGVFCVTSDRSCPLLSSIVFLVNCASVTH